MTVSNEASAITVNGDGSNTTFTYNFLIPYQADGSTPAVLAYTTIDDVVTYLTLNVDYTITGIGSSAGGTVTYPLSGSPLALGDTLSILRDVEYVQPYSFGNGKLRGDQIMAALDNLCLEIQQLKTQLQNITVTLDIVPDPFEFAPLTNQALGALVQSETVTLDGWDSQTYLTVLATGGGGVEVSLNGGGFTSAVQQTLPPATAQLQMTTSAENSSTLSAQLFCGTTSAVWSTTTLTEAPPPLTGILFGNLTRSGFGEKALELAADAPITGTGGTDWDISATGGQVPSGTYGATKSFSLSSYSLTYSGVDTRTTTMVTTEAHIAATSADTSTSNQLRTMATTAPLPTRGDRFIGRPGAMNPLAALWRIPVPVSGYSGSGQIVVTSETPDGTSARGGDFIIGAIAFQPPQVAGVSQNVILPFQFEDISFYYNSNLARTNALGYTTTVGYGVGATRCLFENGPAVPDSYAFVNALDLRGATAHQNHFNRWDRGITGGTVTGAVQTVVSENVFENMLSDAVSIGGQNLLITKNFAKNFLFRTGAHPDFIQHLGALTQDYTNFGEVSKNIGVRNVGQPQGDAQGIFLSDTPSPYYIRGATIKNNITALTARNGLVLTRFFGADCRFNTIVYALNSGSASTAVPTIDADTSLSSTVSYNVANGYSLGTNTATGNVTLPKTLAAYQAAFNAYVDGIDPGFDDREAVLTAFSAKEGGTLHIGSGLYAGALFPPAPGETIGAWNDGTAFAPGDSGWLAAHPPAD